MTVGVIHFMSEMLRVTQMTVGVNHFMSEKLERTPIFQWGSYTSFQKC